MKCRVIAFSNQIFSYFEIHRNISYISGMERVTSFPSDALNISKQNEICFILFLFLIVTSCNVYGK